MTVRAERVFPGLIRTSLLRTVEDLLFTVGPFAFLVALWALLHVTLKPDPRHLPYVGSVIQALARILENGILVSFLQNSLRRILIACFVAIPSSILVGVLIAQMRRVADLLLPVIRFFNSIPPIAWLPMFIIWMGFNEKTIVLNACYGLFFPIVFNTITGVRTVPVVYKNAVLTLGGTWRHVLFDVVLPGALPGILTGVRTGLAYAWRALIAAEMIVAAPGLGYLIFQAQTMVLTDRIIAGMILIGVTWTFVEYFFFRPFEDATVARWGLLHR